MTPIELKAIRMQLSWSQARLAREIGVQRNTVARWEMGLHPISPAVEKLLGTLILRRKLRTS